MKITDAKSLKPIEGEVSQIQTLTKDKKVMNWSIYFSDGVYLLVKGFIFNKLQKHEVYAMNGSYEHLVRFMNKH